MDRSFCSFVSVSIVKHGCMHEDEFVVLFYETCNDSEGSRSSRRPKRNGMLYSKRHIMNAACVASIKGYGKRKVIMCTHSKHFSSGYQLCKTIT